MKKICMLGLVLSFCFIFVFSACAAVITPGQGIDVRNYPPQDPITENQISSTPVEEPKVVLKNGTSGKVDLVKIKSTRPMETYVNSGVTGFTDCWEIDLKVDNVSVSGGRAKIILPYLDGMTQSSAQGRFITILHVINSAANEYEIFSNDGTIANRKPLNLIPAGIEIEVSSFSPFYMKTSTKPENPMNVPQTGDKGLSLGIWVICLSAAFAGLMIFRNRKNKK